MRSGNRWHCTACGEEFSCDDDRTPVSEGGIAAIVENVLRSGCPKCGSKDVEPSLIRIVKQGVTRADADAVVNAANERLRAGGGVCGAVFEEAGYDEMRAACAAIGHCDTGDAVITPGFALKARYVVHAVGPVWSGGRNGEAELLASCYKRSLDVTAENGCESIAFPLISSGIFGYPKEEAWRVALTACRDWLCEHDAPKMEIAFYVLSDDSKKLGERVLRELS